MKTQIFRVSLYQGVSAECGDGASIVTALAEAQRAQVLERLTIMRPALRFFGGDMMTVSTPYPGFDYQDFYRRRQRQNAVLLTPEIFEWYEQMLKYWPDMRPRQTS